MPSIHANTPVADLLRRFPPRDLSPRRMRRRRRTIAALPVAIGVVIGSLGALIAPLSHVAAAGPQALLFGPTVSGGPSLEQQDLEGQGWTVTVADAATWDAMSASQFASYQLLVFGDP